MSFSLFWYTKSLFWDKYTFWECFSLFWDKGGRKPVHVRASAAQEDKERVRNADRANPQIGDKENSAWEKSPKDDSVGMRQSDGGEKWNEASGLKFKPRSSQLCGCNFPFFTVTQAQAARMKTLYLWAWNALWRQEGFPMRPRGPFSTAPAHVNRGKCAKSLLSNCQFTLTLRTSHCVCAMCSYGMKI